MAILTSSDDVRRVLLASRTVAVLGANPKEHKPAYYVPNYLSKEGYAVYPVNPVHVGRSLFGEPVARSLSELDTAIDIVNVFRRSERLPGHLDDILAMTPLPEVVWFQLGIRNDEVAEALSGAGIDVIQDRCILAEHQRVL